MTTLNTEPFKNAYNALNKAKHPLTHDNRIAYVALATILEIDINWKMGINQIQENLDEQTARFEKELSELESLVK